MDSWDKFSTSYIQKVATYPARPTLLINRDELDGLVQLPRVY